jgi:cell division protein FtsL
VSAQVMSARRGVVRPGTERGHLLRVVRGWLVRRVLILGGILVALCLLDVWLRLQVTRVGYELSAARQMQLRLEHEQRELELELAMLRDPGRIGDVARHRLGMVDPGKGQVVFLP